MGSSLLFYRSAYFHRAELSVYDVDLHVEFLCFPTVASTMSASSFPSTECSVRSQIQALGSGHLESLGRLWNTCALANWQERTLRWEGALRFTSFTRTTGLRPRQTLADAEAIVSLDSRSNVSAVDNRPQVA